jgi:hypothetical protein
VLKEEPRVGQEDVVVKEKYQITARFGKAYIARKAGVRLKLMEYPQSVAKHCIEALRQCVISLSLQNSQALPIRIALCRQLAKRLDENFISPNRRNDNGNQAPSPKSAWNVSPTQKCRQVRIDLWPTGSNLLPGRTSVVERPYSSASSRITKNYSQL